MAHKCDRQLLLYVSVFVRPTYNSKRLESPWELNSVIGFPLHPKDVFATH